MWFNMVRYAEIQTKIGRQGTITLFVRYNKKKKRVTEIYIIDTKEILTFLNMVPTKAACCIILSKDSKRNLDMQAGATAKDLKIDKYLDIDYFSIHNFKYGSVNNNCEKRTHSSIAINWCNAIICKSTLCY